LGLVEVDSLVGAVEGVGVEVDGGGFASAVFDAVCDGGE